MKLYTIYCHTHIDSGRRYIGLTSQTMEKRWKNHINVAKHSKNGRWHFPNAIRKYGPDAFSHEILETCTDLNVANLAEECWIEFYDTQNPEKGFNLIKGGGHIPHTLSKNPWDDPEYRNRMLPKFIAAGQTPEARAKSKASLNTPESKAKRSALAKTSMSKAEVIEKRKRFQEDPSYRMKISKKLKKTLNDPTIRSRMSESARVANVKPEVKARISASMKITLAKPEIKDKVASAAKAALARPEVKEKLSEKTKKMWTRPEYREKMTGRTVSQETRNKLSRASKGRKNTPEAIAKIKEYHKKKRDEKLAAMGIYVEEIAPGMRVYRKIGQVYDDQI